MSEMVSRCRACGFEQAGEPADCPVCFGQSGWWCSTCREWRSSRAGPACVAMIGIPSEVRLGSFPAGARVPVRIAVRNRAKKTLSLPVDSLHPALILSQRVLHLRAGEVVEAAGLLSIGQLLPGPHTYRVRVGTTTPVETQLHVEIVEALTRLEFNPDEMVFPNALPGATARRSVILKNTGNLPVTAALSSTSEWIEVRPSRITLEPGAGSSLTIVAKSRKTDCGVQSGTIQAEASGDQLWELPVRLHLPRPELAADAIAFGEVRAGDPHHHSSILRNLGTIRVECTLGSDASWLTVVPSK